MGGIDDTELHDGRVRSFPHERGNWVTSVFILCEYFYEVILVSKGIISYNYIGLNFYDDVSDKINERFLINR